MHKCHFRVYFILDVFMVIKLIFVSAHISTPLFDKISQSIAWKLVEFLFDFLTCAYCHSQLECRSTLQPSSARIFVLAVLSKSKPALRQVKFALGKALNKIKAQISKSFFMLAVQFYQFPTFFFRFFQNPDLNKEKMYDAYFMLPEKIVYNPSCRKYMYANLEI